MAYYTSINGDILSAKTKQEAKDKGVELVLKDSDKAWDEVMVLPNKYPEKKHWQYDALGNCFPRQAVPDDTLHVWDSEKGEWIKL